MCRHDRQRQDGPVPCAARGSRYRWHPCHLHRPQGRPREPDADFPAVGGERFQTLARPGRRSTQGHRSRHPRRPYCDELARGPRAVAAESRAHRATARCRRYQYLHAGRYHGFAALGFALVCPTSRGDPGRRHGTARTHGRDRVGTAVAARSRRRPTAESRIHPARCDSRSGLARGTGSRSGGADPRGAEAAVRHGGRLRSRDLLSGERTPDTRHGDQQSDGVTRILHLAAGRSPRRITPAALTQWQAAPLDYLDCPPR